MAARRDLMRLLVVNHHRALLGGIETYLAAVTPALLAQGHEILFVYEADPNEGDALIPLPPGCQTISSSDSFAMIREWRPDIAYIHAVHDLAFQATLVETYPSVAFAHGYYGLCISGAKTWQHPSARPCQKIFDWKCLLHFHVKGCGGRSPVTMLRDYAKQTEQLRLFKRVDAILTHGAQMHREYTEQGIAAERLFTLPHFVQAPAAAPIPHPVGEIIRLVYVGRFDPLKGGQILLRALPFVAGELDCPIELQMIGAGPAANEWKRLAAEVASPRVQIHFHGWLDREAKDALVAQSNLLIAPSLWPEPFGQVGLEASALGVPAVAFQSGGVAAWLREGINGHLAPADPPTARGLADAIVKSLGNPTHYGNLCAGAVAVWSEFSVHRHIAALTSVFETVLNRRK